MKQLVSVENEPQLARDPISGAILNTNRGAYSVFVRQKTIRTNKEQNLQRELNTVKDELQLIREQLALLLGKGISQ